jgi:hypothetical protein
MGRGQARTKMDNNEIEQAFSYHVNKDSKVFIYWHGKQVMILKDQAAQKFIAKVENLDEHQTQLAIAKITGNFKRGNEREHLIETKSN